MAKSVMEFGGEERFDVPPERLFTVMTDFDVLPSVIPDLQSHERVDERTMRCVIRPGFSFLRGTMKVLFHLAESKAPETALTRVEASGIGAGLKMETRMWIEPAEGGSALRWDAQVLELKGLVSAISPTLLRAAADQVIRHTWDRVRERLANG